MVQQKAELFLIGILVLFNSCRGNSTFKYSGPRVCIALCHNSTCASTFLMEFYCRSIRGNYHRREEYHRMENPLLCRKVVMMPNCSTLSSHTVGLEVHDKHSNDQGSIARQPILTTKASAKVDTVSVKCKQRNRFYQAYRRGKLAAVEDILSQGLEDINCRGRMGRTPVMEAIRRNKMELFDFLVNQNCDLSAADDENNNILHIACMAGNTVLAKKLITTLKYDKESKGKHGRTSLMTAVLYGHSEVFDCLVDLGCNVTAVDYDNNNLLHLASTSVSIRMVKRILSLGLWDIDCREKAGMTPVMLAVKTGHKSMFEFLVSNGSNVTTVDKDNDTILHLACAGGYEDLVEHILFNNMLDIDIKGSFGRTPIMAAAKAGKAGVFDLLLKKGCNVSAIDATNNNILHLTCMVGEVDMVKHVLELGVLDIDRRGSFGRTAVMKAAEFGHGEVVNLLMSKGCNLKLTDDRGNNVLHLACLRGTSTLIMKFVKLRMWDGTEKNKAGQTPVQVAAAKGRTMIADMLNFSLTT